MFYISIRVLIMEIQLNLSFKIVPKKLIPNSKINFSHSDWLKLNVTFLWSFTVIFMYKILWVQSSLLLS